MLLPADADPAGNWVTAALGAGRPLLAPGPLPEDLADLAHAAPLDDLTAAALALPAAPDPRAHAPGVRAEDLIRLIRARLLNS